MIEAELKYVLANPGYVAERLSNRAAPRQLKYSDRYFDHSLLNLNDQDLELRIRVITECEAKPRTLLTYKGDTMDQRTQSKKEYEVQVQASREELSNLLFAMGFHELVAFEKNCRHYEFAVGDLSVGATLVKVHEISHEYLEIEALAPDASSMNDALETMEAFAEELGLRRADQTTDGYSDMVIQARGVDRQP